MHGCSSWFLSFINGTKSRKVFHLTYKNSRIFFLLSNLTPDFIFLKKRTVVAGVVSEPFTTYINGKPSKRNVRGTLKSFFRIISTVYFNISGLFITHSFITRLRLSLSKKVTIVEITPIVLSQGWGYHYQEK